jgi:hypothetical protein
MGAVWDSEKSIAVIDQLVTIIEVLNIDRQ